MDGETEGSNHREEAASPADVANPPEAAEDPTTAFLEVLDVRRNGTIGVVTGLLFAILVYVGFVALPATTTFPRSLYLPLIAVVAFGVAVLVATGLTAITAWRRIRELSR